MKRTRDDTTHTAASPIPPQRIVEEPGKKTKSGPKALVLHSPYGGGRNERFGWGDLFHPASPAVVPGYEENIHIGISSLNAVPSTGSDRTMRRLLQSYRRVFTVLEHCYPYHNVADAQTWLSWADMIRGSSTSGATTATSAAADAATCAGGVARRRLVAAPSRFQYTVKANNLLTHKKLLNMEDTEVIEHVRLFFGSLCRQLDPFLGAVLVQLPPSFQRSPENLARLVELDGQLPKDELELERPSPPSATRVFYRRRRVRVAVEFRHRSWFHEETFRTLRSLGWALVAAHHHDEPTFSTPVDTGVPFMYVRLHGALGAYVGDYGPAQMSLWAERVIRFLHRPSPPDPSAQSADKHGEACRDAISSDQNWRCVPCPREVFFFMNNSDSHVSGVTSSTVDARYLAATLQARLSPPAPSTSTPTESGPKKPTTAVTDTASAAARHAPVASIISVDEHSVSLLSAPSLEIVDDTSVVRLDSPASVCAVTSDTEGDTASDPH